MESAPARPVSFSWPLVIFIALAVTLGIGLTLNPRELLPLVRRLQTE